MSGSSFVEQPPASSSGSVSGWKKLFRKSTANGNSNRNHNGTQAGSTAATATTATTNGTANHAAVGADDDDAQDTKNEHRHAQGVAPAHKPEEEEEEEAAVVTGNGSPPTPGPSNLRRASSTGVVASTGGVTFNDEIEQEEEEAEPDLPEVDEDEIAAPIEFLHKGAPYFWLSNHFLIPIYYDNIRYPSAEHLFQSLKFMPHKPELAKSIRKIELPSDAIRLARKNAQFVRSGWRQEGLNVIAMRQVLLLKFTQHSALRSRLIQTGDRELLNSSPTDVFWGTGRAIGASKPAVGRNELGKALMKTRESLLNSDGLGWGSGAKTV
ncbi:unnamed protein product [Sympodiomycopsis kandeliae]